ncbi:MAG TPA: alpha-isopropylmalate synthase regulatory domain-containing protein [bacterium]|nr:alpha-isopropylmalate synthase regulatory domain-containing protein [bacterium]
MAWLGRGASTDVIEASIRAYLHALNRILAAGPDTPMNKE